MDLILWRHADAGIAGEGDEDLLRPLSAKGNKQAQRMAQWLARQLPESSRVISSPAQRTIDTAKHLGRPFKKRLELSPDASVDDFLGLIYRPNFKGTTVVVGHQPTLGNVVAQLVGISTDGAESEIDLTHLTDMSDTHTELRPTVSIKKGAVWWLRRKSAFEHARWVVVTVQTPELL